MQYLFRFLNKATHSLKITDLIGRMPAARRPFTGWAHGLLVVVWLLPLLTLPATGRAVESDISQEKTTENTPPSHFHPLSVQEAVTEILEQATDHPTVSQKIPNQNDLPAAATNPAQNRALLETLCKKIGNKLGSVSTKGCLANDFTVTSGRSVNGLPIVVKEYAPVGDRPPQARILLLGGIHGDEYSSVSVVFKWLKILDRHHTGLFHWRIAPLVNPDGLLRKQSQRMNQNNVDLNRNFPTASTDREWLAESQKYWLDETHKDPRRYPGPAPLSEPESRWVAEEIERFKPHAVVSVHAPFGLLDFDGPPNAPPERLGQLYLSLLGTYPGSLGRYVGIMRKTPIITIELEHAGIMPSKQEVRSIWKDLIRWLGGHVRDRQSRGFSSEFQEVGDDSDDETLPLSE